MNKIGIIIFVFLLINIELYSQTDTFDIQDTISKPMRFNADFGCGYGLAYGGFLGAKLQYSPISRFAIFGSGGFCIFTLGWQLGAIGYIIQKTPIKPVRVYCSIMYGTIAAYKIPNAKNRSYHGITPGIGMEVRLGKNRKHGFNLDIMYPISTDNFQYDYDKLGGTCYSYRLLGSYYGKGKSSVTMSIGYHFEMR